MKKNLVIAVVFLLVGLLLGFGLSQAVGVKPTEEVSQAEASGSSSQVETPGSSSVPAVATGEEELPSEGSSQAETSESPSQVETPESSLVPAVAIDEEGSYTSKEEVALYLHTYGHLPPNYISKTKAKKAGWVSKQGNLDEVLPGMSIGGSEFYNDEGLLPDAPGRSWTECDINYSWGYRGAERIVFSNDGLIFYTGDHYETFEQLY